MKWYLALLLEAIVYLAYFEGGVLLGIDYEALLRVARLFFRISPVFFAVHSAQLGLKDVSSAVPRSPMWVVVLFMVAWPVYFPVYMDLVRRASTRSKGSEHPM